MADKKISALTGATTPLAGTEVLPIVQSGATVKVSVANLTAGRAIDATSVNKVAITAPATGATLTIADGKTLTANNSITLAGTDATTMTFPTTSATVARTDAANSFTGDQTLATGNIVIGTAGKGIDFSADGQAAGMTSELLDDYEEGTWTPNQGAGLTVVGAFTSSGTYTKIGRVVTVSGILFGATSIATTTGGVISSNLPFAQFTGNSIGRCLTATWTSGTDVIMSGANIYSATATVAETYIIFSATYFI